ncbi:DUF982 domain-containing protein [Neorhizobium sp. BT27B]|uniref:DUF982 domain-containing protein n=1 Tax=Neorhizobium sp. BT27B TaxID=3142625 RepID=UPI003D27597F
MEKQNQYIPLRWPHPVIVRIGFGACEKVDGPDKALEMLQYRWPADRGLHYARASQACEGAAERNSSPLVAREEFIGAALEAAVLAS